MMEEDRTHIINMPLQRKHASLLLVIPNLDKAVVSSGHKQWQLRMEINSSDRSIVSLNGMYVTSKVLTQIFML
jgi:hypothetical protein